MEASRLTSRQRLLLLVTLLTVAFIWGNSMMPGTVSGAFSDWVGALLGRIFGNLTQTETGHGVLRKLAHGTEYLVLGAELWGFLRHVGKRSRSLPILCGLLTALIDETIQLFVPGRCGAVKDVWIDMGGFLTGVLLCAAVLAHLRKRKVNGTK